MFVKLRRLYTQNAPRPRISTVPFAVWCTINCLEKWRRNWELHEMCCHYDIHPVSQVTFQTTMVCLCITRFNTQPFHITPTECVYVLCMNVTHNDHHFLTQHNWFAFVTEMASVYCAVRIGSLHKANYHYSRYAIVSYCYIKIPPQFSI